MSSVLEMLRLKCWWDIQFIFKMHESTLAIPVPDFCRAENVNHLERDKINRATLKIILSDSIGLEIRREFQENNGYAFPYFFSLKLICGKVS